MPCPHCGREVEKGLLTCPFCSGGIDSPLEDCLERAIELIEGGKEKEAMDFLKEVIARYPQSASAHSLLASLYEEEKDFPSAIHHYRQAVELNPESTAEKRKLEHLTGEKYSPTSYPLLPFGYALLAGLFIVLIVMSLPPRKPPSLEGNFTANQQIYPSYNQLQIPYYYYSNTTNITQNENFTSTPPLPSPSLKQPSNQSRTTLPQTSPFFPSLNLPSEQPTPEQFPTANIVIQPSPPQPSQPTEKRGKISIEIKKVPPSFENLYTQGLKKLKERDFMGSEKLLKQALSLAPDERKGEVHLLLALALKEQGKWSEAREHFASAELFLAGRQDPNSRQLLEQAKEGKDYCEERL